jgi:hypothetical protein
MRDGSLNLKLWLSALQICSPNSKSRMMLNSIMYTANFLVQLIMKSKLMQKILRFLRPRNLTTIQPINLAKLGSSKKLKPDAGTLAIGLLTIRKSTGLVSNL